MVKANWIWTPDWHDEDKHVPRLVLFRKEIKLAQVKKAVVQISADSRYKLYINSKLVEVGPCKGDSEVWYMDRINVTDFMKPGINVIAIEVLRYPLEKEKGNYSVFRTEYPGLIFQLDNNITSDNQVNMIQNVISDNSWECFVNRNFKIISESDVFAPLKIYENVKGDSSLKGWSEQRFQSKGWSTAQEYDQYQISRQVSPGNLLPRPIPFLYRKKAKFNQIINSDDTQPTRWKRLINGTGTVTVAKNSSQMVEISAGEEMTGYLKLSMCQGAGSHIKILQSEAYVQDEMTSTNGMAIPVKTNREDYIHGHLNGFTDNYTVAGFGSTDKPETYAPFWFRTFRFIRLEIKTGANPLKITDISYEETGYPLSVKTKVQTSDKSLDAIWKISERTLRRCMHETYEDCPFYEQIQYAMDTRAQILYTYQVSADDCLARKCLDDLQRSQRYDGLLNCSAPNYTSNVIPTFSIYYILMVQDHYQYFGDESLVKKHWPTILRILDFFDKHLDKRGIVSKIGGLNIVDRFWSFTDWTPEWNQTSGVPVATLKGPITAESLVYLLGLESAADLANSLQEYSVEKSLAKRISNLKRSLKAYCVGSNEMLQDGPGIDTYSQQTQVFGILSGVLEGSKARNILKETITHREKYAQCSVALSFYLFRALEKTNLYAYTNDYWNIWRRMVANNCSTCIEAEAGDRSECHGWGALILYELPAVSLGVRPTKPGYAEMLVNPEIGYMDFAKGFVVTPRGKVSVEWHKENEQIFINITAPRSIRLKLSQNSDYSYKIQQY